MKKVYYSLTGRGLYSELLNLVLAIIYCEKNNLELIINSYFWNSRIDKGWEDYFSPTIKYTNNLTSAQIYFKGFNHKLSLRGIYRNPIKSMIHILQCGLNYLYQIRTKNLLSHNIVDLMRDKDFIDSIKSIETWQILFHKKISDIYIYNDKMKNEINTFKNKIGIQEIKYIGVHIRRGDKIKSKEMNNIELEKYIKAIEMKKHISKNIYIATDDYSIINEIRILLSPDYKLYYNIDQKTLGFDENKFNMIKKRQRTLDTKLALIDVDILLNSSFFIGTYSSNLSRIIPCFKGLKDCESIDIQWSPVF